MMGKKLLRTIFRSPNTEPAERRLAPGGQSFERIWSQLIATGATRAPSDGGRPIVLVLQMAKVASMSIRSALTKNGFNAFQCHGLSAARQERDLSRLRRADFTNNLVSHRLGQHIQYVCLAMLVRWYQTYKQRHGGKLKVITLTRDPVRRYASNLLQHIGYARPLIIAWQRARLGTDTSAAIDESEALRDFVSELASIIVVARPSTGAQGCDDCVALARQRWPRHFIVEEEISEWLRPLTWFDTEIGSVFGLDALAAPELRTRGWVELGNDWVDILVLRFEGLAQLVPQIARFVDLPELTLPHINATKDKRAAQATIAAIDAVLETEVGRACMRELRASRYARAGGYDVP
jgi:hypothetical protein